MTIKTQIQQLCKYIEKEHNVKILFCVESGSRAWNMESVDSDYDVRFVFCHNKKKYLDINKPNEIITKHLMRHSKNVRLRGVMLICVGLIFINS